MSKKFWLLVVAVLVVLGVLVVRSSHAQEPDFVPRWTHGPTIAMIATGEGEDGLYHTSILTEGAGWKVGLSLVDAQTFPWVTLDMPFLIGADSARDAFAAKMGLMLTFAGNIGVGATYDLINTQQGVGTGLFTGYSDRKNLTFLFGLTASFGNPSGSFLALGK